MNYNKVMKQAGEHTKKCHKNFCSICESYHNANVELGALSRYFEGD